MNQVSPVSTATDDETEIVRLRKVGNSIGFILPKSMLARLRLKEGDVLHVVEQTERGLKLTPYDPKHKRALQFARQGFRDYAETYRELAK